MKNTMMTVVFVMTTFTGVTAHAHLLRDRDPEDFSYLMSDKKEIEDIHKAVLVSFPQQDEASIATPSIETSATDEVTISAPALSSLSFSTR